MGCSPPNQSYCLPIILQYQDQPNISDPPSTLLHSQNSSPSSHHKQPKHHQPSWNVYTVTIHNYVLVMPLYRSYPAVSHIYAFIFLLFARFTVFAANSMPMVGTAFLGNCPLTYLANLIQLPCHQMCFAYSCIPHQYDYQIVQCKYP